MKKSIQSVKGMTRANHGSHEEESGVKIGSVHSIWPWIAENAGFLCSRFEIGHDGKTAYERLKGKSAKVQGNVREKTSQRSSRG